ncbi:GGDEF domain-containing protein [Shewanella fidelis]|uniref:diguanylate cyclase n=1 Tax=Shewanella fidelis TaxID=173509 RepID=A0AAW8NNT9_9GAMM|nr:diguanylate cyclase [Shewanella fidelis]MDR8524557.1 diguanylate cyclase [Shewanella fidelis]MDW4812033.1 diguanylate cyclase [Shewanella fidelis]MDW4817513.1 diguanylate cyclase [Shewanella fidelis]MDW4821580.1 diguanylate cyclase [Shewanella fidelis]MDW4822639.1 diguanylate cyclase [Shewanella fidelis]
MPIILFVLLLLSISPIAAAKEESNEVKLNRISQFLSNSPQQSESLINELLDDWQTLEREERAKLMMYQSVLHTYNGEYEAAIVLLKKSESLKPDEVTQILIYQYLATNYIALKQYPKVLDLMTANLERIENVLDIEIKIGAYIRLSNLSLELYAYEEQREFALKAMELSQNNYAQEYCIAMLLSAYADLSEAKYSRAKKGLLASRIFADSNQMPLISLMSQKGLASVAINTEDYQSAKKLLEPVLKGYQEFNFQTEINHVNALLSQTYFGLGDYVQAELFATKTMKLNDEPNHIQNKSIASKVLSQLYRDSNQFKLAYEYLGLHQQYENQLLDDTKAKANAYQLAKFKHQEQAREIALLNQERQLMETQKELDQSAQTNNVMIVTMLVGSIFFLSLFLFSSHRQKLRYRKLALIDRLTGVYNRGAGQDFAENEFVQTCLREAHFSVVLFDLDHFKKINDSFGHATGDWALKHVISVVKPLIRDGDIFTRMGGEEFALFLPYSNEEAAIEIAERCQKAIAAIETKYSGHQFSLSASFGVSSNMVDDLSLDPILKRADIALYVSKNAGRNQVTRYSKELKEKDQNQNETIQLGLS